MSGLAKLRFDGIRVAALPTEAALAVDQRQRLVFHDDALGCILGGVMVTTNPMSPTADFRNVFINASERSAIVSTTSPRNLPSSVMARV